jgi:Zn-dependent protease
MVSVEELRSRVAEYLRFSKQEVSGLVIAVLATTLIFAFDDGRASFSWGPWIANFIAVLIIVSISIFVKYIIHKITALREGYLAEFKLWWIGIAIALIVGLITSGKVALVLIGGVATTFISRHRLGEFRYGFSYEDNASISMMGIIGTIHLTIIFALLLHFTHYRIFALALNLNIIMSVLSLLPFPQLDGLQIFWGSRSWYYMIVVATLLFGVLLLSKSTIGLVLAVILMAIGDFGKYMTSSDK